MADKFSWVWEGGRSGIYSGGGHWGMGVVGEWGVAVGGVRFGLDCGE